MNTPVPESMPAPPIVGAAFKRWWEQQDDDTVGDYDADHRAFAAGWRAKVNALDAAKRQAEALRAIVDRLPKTADGVPITPGMKVYSRDNGEVVVCRVGKKNTNRSADMVVRIGEDGLGHLDWSHLCYSTRAAALAPKESP